LSESACNLVFLKSPYTSIDANKAKSLLDIFKSFVAGLTHGMLAAATLYAT